MAAPRTPPITFVQWADDAPVTVGGGSPPVTGYTAWYDAQHETSLADGATAVHPADLSGNGYNLTGSSGCQYYKTTTAKMINGHPAYYFTTSLVCLTATSLPANLAPVYLFTVARTEDPSSVQQLVTIAAGAHQCALNINGLSSPKPYLFDYAQGEIQSSATADTTAHVLTGLGTTAMAINRDGIQIASGTATGTSFAGQLMLSNSGAQPWIGPIGEVVVYCGVSLTPTQIANTEAYLKTKWGTP